MSASIPAGDQVLDLVDLRGGVTLGVDGDDFDALCAAFGSTDCLIWLKKSACRFATASPMVTVFSAGRLQAIPDTPPRPRPQTVQRS